jgi:gluconolactonase
MTTAGRTGLLLALAMVQVACGNDTTSPNAAPSGSGGAHHESVDSGLVLDAGRGGLDAGAGGATDDPLAGISEVTLVQGGFGRIEGPVWKEGALFFSDIPNGVIRKMDAAGAFSVFRDPSGDSNGLALDEKGLLVACEQGNHRVTRTLADGTVTVIASDYQGMPFNAPNDVAITKGGTIYFGDPGFDVAPPPNAPPFHGVYSVSPSGVVTLVSDVFDRPNGITLSIDEKYLYVSDTLKFTVHRIPLAEGGTTGAPEKFVDTLPVVDGMCIDDAGNLYVTTGNDATNHFIQVFAEDGTLRGQIAVPEAPANCAFGGADRKTLFITAQANLYSVVLNVPGRPY